MNTVDFLNTIMPADGGRCVAVPGKGKGFIHFWGDDAQWLVSSATILDARKGLNVYFAPATFGEQVNDDGRRARFQTNVVAVRSFWADIDCGPGKPYVTAREGAQAVLQFSAKLSLGRPYLVSSGRGVHAYWPTDTDMSGDDWKFVANIFKAAMQAEGVHQDMSRTADSSSVLRVPGTHHRKAEPRPVKVVVEGEVTPLDAFREAMIPYAHLAPKAAATDTFDLEGGPVAGFDAGMVSDLTGGVQNNEPSDAHLIAEKCAVIRDMRDKRGDVPQPTWYRVLGVLAHTQQGDDICHEWSAGHPHYSHADTQGTVDRVRAKSGPTTCATFRGTSSLCGACVEVCTSPIQLGRGATVTVDKMVQDAKTGIWRTSKVSMTCDVDGFQWVREGGRMVMQHYAGPDDQGLATHETFCDTVVTPTTRLWIEGIAYIECEMTLRGGEKRQFLIEGSTVGKGKDTLAAELGRNEIVCKTNKGQYMDAYMKGWMSRLRDTADQVIAHRHFGWTLDKSFVFGDTVLQSAGGATRAVLVGMAKSKAQALEAKGDLQTWVDVIDKAYNAPGQEAYQFLIACGFGAPLLSMMKQVSGVTVYAHSEGSGVGKTTAQRAALSAWGNWDQMMLADNKATHNALWALIGAYNSLPVVYDELTNQKNDVASDLVFSVSSGRGKERMKADGGLRENNSNWCTIMLASGNTLLSEKLALHRANPEAEISRLFEFTLQASPHLTPNEAIDLFPKLIDNYGHAGREFMRHVVDNYDEVQSLLDATQKRLNEQLKITQVERHWSALMSCAMVSVALCRKLGLLQFDARALRVWMVARLQENRLQRDDAVGVPTELFGNLLTDLWQGILVTNGEGDLRRGIIATVVEKPRGPLVGRAIVPVDKKERPILVLNDQSVREWASKKGVSAREIFAAVVAAGWCEPQMVRYSLGKGTTEYSQTSSYVRCWKLYADKIGDSVMDVTLAQKVSVIKGGLNDAAGGAGA